MKLVVLSEGGLEVYLAFRYFVAVIGA
jgi:hypothetical protein